MNSGDRRRQILARIAIDRERYTEAMIDSPDMRPHFARPISIGVRSEEKWEEHFSQYPGDGGLVPAERILVRVEPCVGASITNTEDIPLQEELWPRYPNSDILPPMN